MRILYITTVSGTMAFFEEYITKLTSKGDVVDIACGKTELSYLDVYKKLGCKIYNLGTSRSPLAIKNFMSVSSIKKIVKEGKYDIVHCHTPIISAFTRIACRRLRKNGVKVVYTAHGFHFYSGASLKNWILYFPVEWICSFWTDGLVTINSEDYSRAKRFLHAKHMYYIPGVGIDSAKFRNNRHMNIIRNEFGIPEEAILFLSVGDLLPNKNHQIVIKAISEIKNSNLYYIIAGANDPSELNKLITDNSLNDRVFLAGYRRDITNFFSDADVYILPSFREGLNVSIMEAMASGIPCLVSDIRGNRDLIDDQGGLRFDPHNLESVKEAIEKIITKKDLWSQYGSYNQKKVEMFDAITVDEQMDKVYKDVCRS